MADPGYSGTPLVKKLGLQDSQTVLFVNLPPTLAWLSSVCEFQALHTTWPEAIQRQFDVIVWFGMAREILERDTRALFSSLTPNGCVWICWPKKASKIPTTITENVLREVLLPSGLVDVKVCAVDEVWSGLKFMIRKELRAGL